MIYKTKEGPHLKKKINNYRSRPSFKYYKISKFEENMDFRYIPKSLKIRN